MKCNCGSVKWKTLETRQDTENYDQVCVLRRKQCLACGHRIWTIEQLLREINRVQAEPKPRKPKVVKDPKPQEAKSRMKRRVEAMMKVESRRDSKGHWDDYFGPDNDYLNKY